MNNKEAKERIEKLRAVINYHRHLYHVLDKQEISDAALDSLKKELFELEQEHPDLVAPDSPTQRVGGEPLKAFRKVQHVQRMLSLNDVFSREDFQAWHEKISKLLTSQEVEGLDFYCELKIDGLAIEMLYEHGVFQIGSTRGDGMMGEDITRNLKTIEAIPLSIKTPDSKSPGLPAGRRIPATLVVRGEVFISKKEFERVNRDQKKKGLSPYANPRNIAAGSVRQLDPKVTASRRLDSFAYDIITDVDLKTHEQKHQLLKTLGFKTNAHNQLCRSLDDVLRFYEHVGKIREKLSYEIDGVVVIVNDDAIFQKLGVAGKAPRGAVAFKFPQSQATTKVLDISIQVGRTGAMTPVAALKPIQVGGITITRATLHNEDEIKRLGLMIGDTVIVGRAGDVIPDIIKVLPELRSGAEKRFAMPKYCPSCKTKLEKSATEALWRCPNQKCFARQRRSFYHFVSRSAFNIEGLGPKIIDKLLDFGLAADPSDLFSLEMGDIIQLDDILPHSKPKSLLPGFAEKSAENLIQSIRERKRISLSRFIYALGIRNVGEETAIDLAKKFNSLEKLRSASLADIESILNIGPVVGKSIHSWFQEKRNEKYLEKLLRTGITIETLPRGKGGKLSGKTFVLTGGLESMEREEAKEKIRALGGETSESVSKNISYVVAGKDPGSKLDKAKKLGVEAIDEKTFLTLLK